MKMYRTLVAQSKLSTLKMSRWFVGMRSQSLVALSRSLVALYKLWPKMWRAMYYRARASPAPARPRPPCGSGGALRRPLGAETLLE